MQMNTLFRLNRVEVIENLCDNNLKNLVIWLVKI